MSSHSASFKNALQTAQEINDYDFNKVMGDYELAARQNRIHGAIKRKWATKNNQYKQKIRQMKRDIEEQYKEKNQALMKKINDKNQVLVTSLTEKSKSKDEEKRKRIDALVQKEKDAQNNVELFLEELEEERIENGKRTKEKMALFQERNLQKRKEFHDNFTERNSVKENHHRENWVKHQRYLEELEKEREEKAFQKYQAYYWHTKDQERNNREYKNKNNNKLQAKTEKLEELERKLDARRKEIMKKIKKMTKEKEKCEDKKKEEIEFKKTLQEEKMKTISKNLKILEEDRMLMRQEILEYENALLSRSAELDEAGEVQKNTNQDKGINNQTALEKDLRVYNKKLAMIKNDSIFKKSPVERYEMYRDKKRKEYELKKKLEEDKKPA